MEVGEMKAKKLPDFSKMTLEEIARFWDEHDSADYWDQMEEARVEFKEPLDETLSIKLGFDSMIPKDHDNCV